MGFRFRKSKKIAPGVRLNFSKSGISTTIGPRGNTVSIGKRGVYRNIGIPGTGISYRTKVADAPSSKRKQQPAQAAQTVGVRVTIDEEGSLRFYDGEAEITDPGMIASIKRAPEFKAALPGLKEQQRAAVAGMVAERLAANEAFIKAYTASPMVVKRRFYEVQLEKLQPQRYQPQRYAVPAPTLDDVRAQLEAEADANVKGMPWSARKLKEKYVAERLDERHAAAMDAWTQSKHALERSEGAKAMSLNEGYMQEYEETKAAIESALSGDAAYVEAACEDWIESVELPVEIATQFEYRADEGRLMVDLDLPEIEDLPTETAVQLASGAMKVKDKTQKELRADYAECVFGLAVYVAACLFGISPDIEHATVSGYTQRRNKAGDVEDDYIYSIKFDREGFYGADYGSMDPEAFCMGFENRCNMTSTKVFKSIEPFD